MIKTPQEDRENYTQNMRKELKMLFTFPKDFDFESTENVNRFFERLEDIRKRRLEESQNQAETDDSPYPMPDDLKNYKWDLKELAQKLHITSAAISRYRADSKSRLKSIPKDKLRAICAYYYVTPHYIVGLVPKTYQVLSIDEEGNIKYKDGDNGILEIPILNFSPDYVEGITTYKQLYEEDKPLFFLLLDVMNSNKREQLRRAISAILDL